MRDFYSESGATSILHERWVLVGYSHLSRRRLRITVDRRVGDAVGSGHKFRCRSPSKGIETYTLTKHRMKHIRRHRVM